jgi:hypothetical protein
MRPSTTIAKHRKVVVMPTPKPEPPAGNSWPHAIGTLAIGAIVAVGLVTIGSWVEVYMRPPPGSSAGCAGTWNRSLRTVAGMAADVVRHQDGISRCGRVLAKWRCPMGSRCAVISSGAIDGRRDRLDLSGRPSAAHATV